MEEEWLHLSNVVLILAMECARTELDKGMLLNIYLCTSFYIYYMVVWLDLSLSPNLAYDNMLNSSACVVQW
jgi:hypothetical protein